MRYFFSRLLVVLSLFLCAVSARATIDATLQMQLGNPSGATMDTNNHNHYLIQRTVEALDYSDTLGEPNWASWDLTAADIGNSGRSSDFFTDHSLPADFYEVTTDDYNGVGNINFNRGHMCPSEDRTDNTNDNDMVFLMSNIIPQAATNNQGVWGNFEAYCQTQAKAGNELLITCGPSLFNNTFIPSGKAQIPQYTWKIAVIVPSGTGTALSRITASTRVISLKIPNSNNVTANWSNYVTSARQIEVDTGFTFFTALPPDVASTLRNEVDGSSSPAPLINNFSPTSGAIGIAVTINGTNFNAATAVAFNGVAAQFTVNSATQITAIVPIGASPGFISVTTPNGTAVSSGTFTVTGISPDLAITSTHLGNFTQGATAQTYTLTVTNRGTLASSGTVSVTDTLPAGLTATAISGNGWTTSLSPLSCTRTDSVTAGSSFSPIIITVDVAANAPSLVTNIATVSTTGDTNSANDTASDPTVIVPPSTGGNTNLVILAGWNTRGLNVPFGPSPFAPTTNIANILVAGLTRGSGVVSNSSGATNAWGGTTFNSTSSTDAIAANEFCTFGLTANSGFTVSYNAISTFNYRRSGTGPTNGLVQYQIGSGAFNDIASVNYPTNTSSGGTLPPIDLSTITALQNVPPDTSVTFRIVNWNATGSGGTWYIYDSLSSSAPDLAISGTISPVVTLTPVEAWRLQYFGTTHDTGTAADTAIATSDGMANLLKYAFGLDPTVPATNPIVGDLSNGHLRITLPKNPNATDVTFTVEQTDDLANPNWTNTGTMIDQNTSTLLQVHDTNSVSAPGTQGYLRLRVSRP